MVQVHYGADYCWLSCKWFSFESCGFPRVTRHVVIELSDPSRKEMSIWVHLCNTPFITYELACAKHVLAHMKKFTYIVW